MNKTTLFSTIIKCMLLAGLAILPFGCEDDPSDETANEFFEENPYTETTTDINSSAIKVSTTSSDDSNADGRVPVTHVGQTISFRAAGGSGGYTWSLGESSVGSITPTHDDDSLATYVASEVSDNTVIATDSHGKSGTSELVSENSTILAIVPSSETITAPDLSAAHGTQVQFSGYGGTPPYSWSVSSTDLGSVDSSGLYTVNGRWGYGANTISVRDAAGTYATATVTTQAAETD